MLGKRLALTGAVSVFPDPEPRPQYAWFLFLMAAVALLYLVHGDAFAGSRIPGTDESDQLEAAGTLLRMVDSMLFSWGARLFAGLCILSAAWHLKEQRFGLAVVCSAAAILFGTAPMWVRNIFDIGGGRGVFSSDASPQVQETLRA